MTASADTSSTCPARKTTLDGSNDVIGSAAARARSSCLLAMANTVRVAREYLPRLPLTPGFALLPFRSALEPLQLVLASILL